ncbi:hypothetical protein HH214_13460 [Mucilaginibacter robiniae]|uniref:Pyridoxamine 5'-phosphate oxidase Alr4036 family FMN-binding domain-containing protein n=1 Tax=Mucilaginibacter robiniae TaxID=2728022 RepID=A0A7L5E7G4_9SPHI|nr:pyridoxamine 5'-phosphate oxidase family protein [Mucilaginibacter robiniae]QJD96803.1 hypothetical protein HH214_13460 [Mucilaginibacter robiniae]
MQSALKNIFDDCWQKLTEAGQQPQSGFRNITVANLADDGINSYTVVLRKASADTSTLTFHTDWRSPKVNQIQQNSRITILTYNSQEKVQLLLKGTAVIYYQDEVSLQAWQQQGYKSRKSYLAQPAPSTPVDEAVDGLSYLSGQLFESDDPDGYENFGVVEIKVDFLEWVKLSHEGNRRASFTRNENKAWQHSWLIP